ncbi:hypothetical protein GCM10027053_51470 [Intrasporangium mesophilum]
MSVRTAVRAAAAIVSVSTFVLLYFGLVDLARLAGETDARAYLYPLAIDGMVAAAYAVTLDPHLTRGGLRFAWAVIIVGSSMSLFGQWLHAEATSSWTFAGPVAAAPALCMALVWHLLFLVSVRRPVEAPVSVPADTATVEAPDSRPGAADTKPDVPDARTDTSPVPTDLLTAAREALSAGADTGPKMAEALGFAATESGYRRGRRWLREASLAALNERNHGATATV